MNERLNLLQLGDGVLYFCRIIFHSIEVCNSISNKEKIITQYLKAQQPVLVLMYNHKSDNNPFKNAKPVKNIRINTFFIQKHRICIC